ncbi:MAG: efflux RND transporter permease subunit [Bacteroidales bacterium]|nr:efflux RND transporter permease subunit [Bacteroidales bacterium]
MNINNLGKSILRYRWLIIILVLAFTAFTAYQITKMQINSDVISSLPDDDPDAALLKRIASQFGSNKMGMIIVETDDIFQTDVLEHVNQITDSIDLIDGVMSVTSLTNIMDINEFGIGHLVDPYDLPDTEEELNALRERVFSKEMYRGSIVSEDGTATLIIFSLTEEADIEEVALAVIEKTESMDLPETLYYAGSPMMVTAISGLISNDLFKLLPIAFLVIAIILALFFKTVRGVALPLITVAIAITWTLGLMALFGYQMSMISNNMPIILLAVGSAYTIHVLNRINQMRDTDRRKVLLRALSYIFIPLILSAITTAIGFMSFIFGAYLEMIREFGIFTSLGTLFAAFLSLFFTPSLIAAFSIYNKKLARKKSYHRYSLLQRYFLAPLKDTLVRHPKYILSTWGTLILISIGGIFMIERSVDIQDYFKEGNPARTAENIMINKFGGSKPIFVLFKGDIQSPEVLITMVETANYMQESPDVYTTQSLANLIMEINLGIGEGLYRIPPEKEMIEQLWAFSLDGSDLLKTYVNEDLNEAIIISKFMSPDNKAKIEFASYMDTFIREHSTENCQIEITGMPFVDITMDTSLIRSQFGSLSIAIVMVIIFVGLMLRSLKTGIFATVPIVASIIILFGVMGFAGIPLNIATVLVASVALGIGIDYSIHVINNVKHLMRTVEDDMSHALEETILISGKGIVINVISVSTGFLILLFSEMVPLQYFGFLVALSMVGSGVGSLTLLPVILVLDDRRIKRKNSKKKP